MCAVLGAAGVLAGCGSSIDLSGISGSTPLPDALNQLAGQVAADPVLRQLTVSDVVQGFEDYATGASGGMLTSDQQSQLADLQSQLDSGEITLEEFTQGVEDLMGDMGSGHGGPGHGMMGGPFPGRGMMGGPFPGRGGEDGHLGDALNLTEEQQAQAEEIQTRLHDDIDTLRTDAETAIKALLTADQLAALEELQAQTPPRGRGHGHGPDPFQFFAAELQLTDEQKASIDEIRANLRDAVRARHEQAREEFRAILTADQLAILDQLEAEHPDPES
jgi:Spy/CpxP family protein refolding chaperone